jgi:four helix bundle protein
MTDFRSLNCWVKGHELTLQISEITKRFPPAERFGMTLQLRKTATNIPVNLAYSCGSDIDQDSIRSVHVAARNCSELEYQLILAKGLNFINDEESERLTKDIVAIRKMIFGYLRNLRVQ